MNEGAISAVIVEDEEPSRKRLKRLLSSFSDTIEIVGEAEDGLKAVELITNLRPRLLFLDIQLPGIDGLRVLEKIPYQPAVIFTSAYDKYALEAFQAIAIDYLLKPIDAAVLEKAINKLKKVGFRQEPLSEKIEYLLQVTQSTPKNRIPLRVGDRIDLVNPGDVIYFQSEKKYTKVKTVAKEYLIDTTLADLERKLNPRQFVRIHRSAIVNIEWVTGLHKWFGGRLKVRLRDHPETELIASRSYAAKLTTW
ncbi:MAG: response regulator transcription factor [Chitinispirillaceae bacterium]|nr:response regulator transcription factor [Chitinispirillaceae bacterium]